MPPAVRPGRRTGADHDQRRCGRLPRAWPGRRRAAARRGRRSLSRQGAGKDRWPSTPRRCIPRRSSAAGWRRSAACRRTRRVRPRLSAQVRPRERRLIAVEALLRWRHPEFGGLPTDQFIAVAEASGLIGDIGRLRWVPPATRAGAGATPAIPSASPSICRRSSSAIRTCRSRLPVPWRRHGSTPRCWSWRSPKARTWSARQTTPSGRGRGPAPGRQAGDRRFRHRLVVAGLPEMAAVRRAQDRPLLRAHPRRGPARRGDHRHHRHPGAPARQDRGRRGCRDRAAAAGVAAAARKPKASCWGARTPPRRSRSCWQREVRCCWQWTAQSTGCTLRCLPSRSPSRACQDRLHLAHLAAGGEEIGQAVAERLGYRVIDARSSSARPKRPRSTPRRWRRPSSASR